MEIFKNKVVMWGIAIVVVAFIILVFTKESKKTNSSTWESITNNLDLIFR